ncbi:TspO/MBR family protein [Halalkalibacter alkalisediminis]|uniref:TspO/MBR family protein n=1 Tax=Halalkalibacter alkalisediminis TaxID=935616 RepID=A0ABV6NMT2_9BACI|nr:TspO/MBR family protein [Halalkalibacter alkalisediminis]
MLRFSFNLFAIIFVISMNYLANALPFNQQTTSEISSRLVVLFTPAGYVFGIWSFIYILLLIWVIRQLFKRHSPVYKAATPLFTLSCFLNSFWLLVWHYEYFILSVVIMISLLITLSILYIRIKSLAIHFFDLFPFSVYLGWISVATIANISYVLVKIGWDGFGISQVTWTIFMLIVASALAIFFRLQKGDVAYPLVLIWAFIGIGVNNLSTYPFVSFVAFFLATIVFVYGIFGKRKQITVL